MSLDYGDPLVEWLRMRNRTFTFEQSTSTIMSITTLLGFKEQYEKSQCSITTMIYTMNVSLVYYTKLVMMGKNKKKRVVNKDLYDQVENLDYFNMD